MQLIALVVLGVASLVARYVRGDTVERLQIRWYVSALSITGLGFVGIIVENAFRTDGGDNVSGFLVFGGLLAIPISMGIAVTRYRLYEIDRLISRTIGWAAVTGILAAVFVGLVVSLQALLAPVTDESTIAVAVSTLVAFALFQPLRRSIQHAVDRRFDRARYDGQTMAAVFADRVRNEVDLVTLHAALVSTAAGAVRPTGAALWAAAEGRIVIRSLPWLIAAIDVVVFLVTSLHPSDGGFLATLLYVVGIASFSGVGALLWTRVPANPIGPLLLASGTLLVVAITVGMYADIGAIQTPPWPGATAARLIGDVMFIYPFLIAFVAVPLVFPDGRLPSPRYRWVVGSLIFLIATWTLLGLLFDGETARLPALAFLGPYAGTLEILVLVATLVSFGAAVVAVAGRFRHGGATQRQQVKWLAADVGIAAAVLPLALLVTDLAPDIANALSSIAIFAMFALPIVIAIAILRYRLYEIDRIVSRTIGWAVVTGLLAIVFVVLVVVLQAVLAPLTRENTLAVAGSTLVALALFGPLRRRVQRAVDRRFDRTRYDGQTTTAVFADRVRNEVDLVTLREALVATASEAVRPTGVSLWLRTGRGS